MRKIIRLFGAGFFVIPQLVLRETPEIEKYPYTYRNCHTVICLCSSYTPPNQNAWIRAIYRRFVETVYTLLEARVSE